MSKSSHDWRCCMFLLLCFWYFAVVMVLLIDFGYLYRVEINLMSRVFCRR